MDAYHTAEPLNVEVLDRAHEALIAGITQFHESLDAGTMEPKVRARRRGMGRA